MTAIGGVVAAVYGALNVASLTAAVPTGLGCGVYDEVPQRPAFPYLRIGDVTENRDDTFEQAIREGTLRIHVFSRYGGTKEAAAILSQVETLIDDTLPEVTGHTLFGLHCESTMEVGIDQLEGIGKVRHYVQVYRVWTT